MKVELSGHYGYRRIVKTMLPMVAAMVVMSVYSIVDGFFVSNYAGSTAFAAMNIIWPALAVVSSLGLLIGSGGSALVSKTLGEGDKERASLIFSMLVRLILITGAAAAAALFFLMEPLARLLGADGDMVPLCVTYGRIVVLVMPLNMAQLAFQSFFMTAERPQLNTFVSVLCGLVNIVLDLVFVVWFGWGLTGAAVATALSMSVGGLYPLLFFLSKRNDTHLQIVRFRRFDYPAMLKACSNGLSEFVGNVSFNVIAICYNLQLMRYVGEGGVSAYGIIMYVGFIFGAIFIGYNSGITQIIAFNYGAQNHSEMTSLLKKSMALIALGGIFSTVCTEVLSPALARIFVGYDDALVELTTHAIRLYMLSFLLAGFNMFTSAWFTALGNGKVSAFAAFMRTLVFELASVMVLPLILGIDGIWLSVNVAEVLAFIMTVTLILAYRKKYGY